ncbi:hypothetical protein GV794_01360 [Nocardia cyriacigeorgica]|uniref:Uncharacterized protein n=1 Tax=Nocardia cyriacigeorgica TaxID=135487 RepID=A0A6P1D242_9NOCA|nr:hypothetical protein [Nocardia cyriacigeorgica]NEW40675.1 hypothetical protein [Nocardia cyriacigeorgica]NEW44078.1 hypothetical protein [Nocardia cyriacigeorgica]NEW51097.1 hypothetical protein [Nocardia cyriacigeorgica]NEW54320.1 hypothetical protein [Nocardia cyriacigeorgica]
MLDRDDTPEVIAPAGEYVRAIATSAGQVAVTVRDLVVPCRPASSLDHALFGELDWITTTFDTAVKKCLTRANAAFQDTVDGANAHDVADILGAAYIRGHQAI